MLLKEGAINELLFWKGLPRLKFANPICPPTEGVSIRMASDASDFGWGGHTMQDVTEYAHEYFSEEECVTSFTDRELLGVLRCLRAMMHVCAGMFVVFQVDAQNLLGIINRGSPRLKINELARGSYSGSAWSGVPRLKWSGCRGRRMLLQTSGRSSSSQAIGWWVERWGSHTMDLFASGENNQCERFYSLQWCRGSARCDAFALC